MKEKAKPPAKAPGKTARAPKKAAKTKKPAAGARAGKAAAVKKEVSGKKGASAVRSNARKTAQTAARVKRPAAKGEKAPAESKKRAARSEQEAQYSVGEPVVGPVGDATDGEGRTVLGEEEAEPVSETQANVEVEAFRAETKMEASDAALEAGPGMEAAAEALEAGARRDAKDAAERGPGAEDGDEAVAERGARRPENLQRLQKILSQAGIASRRRAEEMIVAGRVMVNGQVVTTLGSKADPVRDHIRVDGKLLRGAERHRYFLLNKPRGYVTTVSDPEGRPTVMKFFENMRERVYPVGRLDYQSEGLLLMTNDGELANLLTKAGSGVEKTYLVKVAGRPTEQELERLREGVEIERGEQGSERVRTSPARVRQVRVGENPWFEVVLMEGRNRELRKMFAAVGHFAEKIRRVGYGPLVLDVGPGRMRELRPEEVSALRLTAEGKMKPKRIHASGLLPREAGRAAEQREDADGRRRTALRGGGDFGRREAGAIDRREGKPPFHPRGERESRWRREEGANRGGERRGFTDRRGGRPFGGPKQRFDRPGFGAGPRRERGERDGGGFRGEGRPFRERGQQKFDRGERKPFRAHGERPYWKRGPGPQGRREDSAGQSLANDSERGPIPRSGWRGKSEPRGEARGPRQAAPAFRGQGKRFGGGRAKPSFGGRPGGFGGSRRDGGRDGLRPGGGRGFGGRKRG